MQVKYWFSLTMAIVVKDLGYVQNMYVEILLVLCQKGSFEIDYFNSLNLSALMLIVLASIYTFHLCLSIPTKNELKMPPGFFGIRCKINVKIGRKVLRDLNVLLVSKK